MPAEPEIHSTFDPGVWIPDPATRPRNDNRPFYSETVGLCPGRCRAETNQVARELNYSGDSSVSSCRVSFMFSR